MPKDIKTISVRIESKAHNSIKDYSKKNGNSMMWLISRAIEDYLKKKGVV